MARPDATLALLDERSGNPEWAFLFAADPLSERREKLAACPGLPPAVVETLAADPDVQVVAELALWTTPEVAAGLAGHPHAEVRRAVAANEATPPAVLAALITGEGLPPARRCQVCDREDTPFAHDPRCSRLHCDLPPGASCDGSHESTVHDIRQAALENPATPTEAVVGFAGHSSTLLRWALAARPDLPPQVYGRLAADTVPGVRAELAGNPAIGEPLIRALADDPDHNVRRALAHHPMCRPTYSAAWPSPPGSAPPCCRASPPPLPQRSRSSPSHRIRPCGCSWPGDAISPAGIRDALAADPDAKVVKSIASHPGLSEAQLRAMVDRHGVRVVAKVAANPDAPPALLEDLARHEPRYGRRSARSPGTATRRPRRCSPAWRTDRRDPWPCGHPALPPPVIVELLSDTDGQVAEAAAANPSLPLAVMKNLVPQR